MTANVVFYDMIASKVGMDYIGFSHGYETVPEEEFMDYLFERKLYHSVNI